MQCEKQATALPKKTEQIQCVIRPRRNYNQNVLWHKRAYLHNGSVLAEQSKCRWSLVLRRCGYARGIPAASR